MFVSFVLLALLNFAGWGFAYNILDLPPTPPTSVGGESLNNVKKYLGYNMYRCALDYFLLSKDMVEGVYMFTSYLPVTVLHVGLAPEQATRQVLQVWYAA